MIHATFIEPLAALHAAADSDIAFRLASCAPIYARIDTILMQRQTHPKIR
jgi:hypothetical protein